VTISPYGEVRWSERADGRCEVTKENGNATRGGDADAEGVTMDIGGHNYAHSLKGLQGDRLSSERGVNINQVCDDKSTGRTSKVSRRHRVRVDFRGIGFRV
jgi:hypothetical protein